MIRDKIFNEHELQYVRGKCDENAVSAGNLQKETDIYDIGNRKYWIQIYKDVVITVRESDILNKQYFDNA